MCVCGVMACVLLVVCVLLMMKIPNWASFSETFAGPV
jgi:competence protein ComGC